MSEPPPPNFPPPPVPDSDAIKAKYAEIAALKKSIEEKRMAQHAKKPIPAWYGRGRGSFRGYRGAHLGAKRTANSHRNMSLVFNEPTTGSTSSLEASSTPAEPNSTKVSFVSSISSGGMTLINSDIYQQESISRQKQIDATNELKQKLKQRKLQRIIDSQIQLKRSKTDSFDRVKIGGEIFAVSLGGLALKLISEPVPNEEKVVRWNNQMYVKQDNGDLVCPTNRGRITADHCIYFTKTGFCQKGSSCPFQHDQNYIRLCRSSLNNSCHNAQCLLSHKRTQFNTPMCRYFLENKCSNPQCLFQHNKPDNYEDPNVEIWVCRPFSVSGVCSRGLRCPFLHLYICPDFQEDGTCTRGKSCTLSHLITQGTQKLILNNKPSTEEVDDVLVESEDEGDGQGEMVNEGGKRTKKEKVVKRVISSYTVDPHLLFDKGVNDKYSYYIDRTPTGGTIGSTSTSEILTSADNNTYREDQQFMIDLESSDSDLDDLEENNDYVGLDAKKAEDAKERGEESDGELEF